MNLSKSPPNFTPFILPVLALLVAIAIAWFTQRSVVLYTALNGYTPVGMMHAVSSFSDFRGDFPNGEAEMMKSSIGHIYAILGQVGASDFVGAFLVVAAEALTLFAGGFYFARRSNPELPVWTAFAAGILLGASTIASADFGRWGHPFYGSVYNFAYGLGLAAVAAALGRRLSLSGLFLGLAATVHPIITLFFAIPTGIVVLFRLRSYHPAQIVLSALVAAGLAGAWFLFAYSDTDIAGGTIDGQFFVTLTRLMSSHWHPVHIGVFGERAWEGLLPATALFALCAVLMASSPMSNLVIDRSVAAAIVVLFVTSVVGAFLSEASQSPFVVKLALQRASLAALLLAAGLSIPRLLALALRGPIAISIFAAAFVALAFVRSHGLPIAGLILFVGLLLLHARQRDLSIMRKRVLWLSLLTCIAVPVILTVNGHFQALVYDSLATLRTLMTISFLLPFLMLVVGRFTSSTALSVAAVCLGAFLWSKTADPVSSPTEIALGSDYLEVQLWARNQTQPGSVFMVEPTMSYGWRQYSQRPSFGTMREWLYSGWIYRSDLALLTEGLRRVGLLGVSREDLQKYAWTMPRAKAYAELMSRVRLAYNNFDAEALTQLSRENGIAYFVFNRSFRTDVSELDVVYQNESFAVVKTSK